jgi:hypothetical protein
MQKRIVHSSEAQENIFKLKKKMMTTNVFRLLSDLVVYDLSYSNLYSAAFTAYKGFIDSIIGFKVFTQYRDFCLI